MDIDRSEEDVLTILPFLSEEEEISSLLRKVSSSQQFESILYLIQNKRQCFFKQAWELFEIEKVSQKSKFHLFRLILRSGFTNLSQLNLLSRLDQSVNQIPIQLFSNYPLPSVQFLIQEGIEIKPNMSRCLETSTRSPEPGVFEYLLEYSRKVPSVNLYSTFLETIADNRNNLERVRLLRNDSRLDPSDHRSWSLIVAIYHDRWKIVDLLLKDPRVDPSDRDQRAIVEASRGHPKMVRRLIQDHRVDPSARNNLPIIDASEDGHYQVAEILLKDRRVNPAARNQMAIIKAAGNSHYQVIELLLRHPKTNPSVQHNRALISAIQGTGTDIDRYQTVKLLLSDPRVDPSDRNNFGLEKAVEIGYWDIAKLLINHSRMRWTSNVIYLSRKSNQSPEINRFLEMKWGSD